MLFRSGLAVPATGAPSISDKRAEAARIQAEIEANGMRISSLDEQFNQARIRLDAANSEIARVKAKLAAAEADSDRISRLVRSRAAAMYVGAASTTPLAPITAHHQARWNAPARIRNSPANAAASPPTT